MRWAKISLRILAFLCMYIAPILLFSGVKPFIHGEIKAGMTRLGYIAIALISVLCWLKITDYVKKQKESVPRALFLCVTPIAVWVLVNLGIDHIAETVTDIAHYWDKVLIFVLLGCIFNVFAERIKEDASNG